MSSYRTHALIGAVGGLFLARVLAMLPHGAALSQTIFGQLGAQGVVSPGAASVLSTAGLVVGSAVLALVSDIDEPGSWVARRARTVVALACAPLLGAVGLALAEGGMIHIQPIIAAVLGALVGLGFIGPLLGHLIVRLIRAGAGGHRKLTHSLLLGGLLALASEGLWFAELRAWAIIPAALAWGILLHDLGDVGTPAGLPLLYPMSDITIHALPRRLRPYGEPIAAVIAVIVGFALWQR
jgi:membrane-bound metal-dependent hydrolase YbcI (DUF457 family)